MNRFLRHLMAASWLGVTLLSAGCPGKDGPAGPGGAPGSSALVALTDEPSGANCAAGGTRIDAGLDADADGTLDAAEVATTRYVCDGATGGTGADGFDALVASASEAAGANCADGGFRVESGVDLDRDGLLDAGEVTGTEFACNGAAGGVGAAGYDSLTTLAAEAAGANCAAGGTLVQSGLDADRDLTLDAGEVTWSRYVCDGASALVTLTAEAAGANCAAGGTRVDAGLDADASGALAPAEVTSTRYVCDGAAGGTGAAGFDALVTLTAEPAGPSCAAGGARMESGVDLDRDGLLDAGEVTGVEFACDGVVGMTGADGINALTTVTAEPAGANCAAGGALVQSGLDADGSLTLAPAEVSYARYVCDGVDGTNGTNGTDGYSALVLVTAEPAGASCAYGGSRVDAGVDLDRDGVLDAAEVTSTSWACGGVPGSDGADGYDTLVAVTPEGPGACTFGGDRVDSGRDLDRDGVLDAVEVTSTGYACNGAPGADGFDGLVSVTAEPAGASCTYGGSRISAGLDVDRSGTLDPAEVTSTSYACSGAPGPDGISTLLAVTPEPAGVNCASGGSRIDTGLDTDRSGVLDAAEVTATSYVCDGVPGANGTDGYNALVSVTAEPAGANCAYGGSRIDGGLDLDRSGVLDPAEVTSTQYLCNVDTRDPEVVAWTPGADAIVIPNDQVFSVTFSEAMDPATIDASRVFLADETTGLPVPATLTYDAGTFTATLTPLAQLTVGTGYSLNVEPSARDLEGNALATYFYAQVTPNLDAVPPALVRLAPVDGGTCGAACVVSAYFDEPLAAAGVSGGRYQLVDGTGAAVAGGAVWNAATNAVDFTPTAPLVDSQTYTAIFELIAVDATGNAARITETWSFTVETVPRMTGTPVLSATDVATGQTIAITIPVNGPTRNAGVYVGTSYPSGWYGGVGYLTGNASGEGYIQGNLTVPAVPADGSYSVWVCVDDASSGTCYLVNDAYSTTFYTRMDATYEVTDIPVALLNVTTAAPSTLPDLEVAITAVTAVDAGNTEIAWSVTNTGSDAGPVALGLYWDPASLAPYTIPDAWVDLTGVAAGATVTGTVTVGRGLVTGTTVGAYVDLMSAVVESAEWNNSTIVAVATDLVTTIDSFVVSGAGTADLTYTVRNQGNFEAGPFALGIFVDPPSPPTVGSTPTQQVDFAGLAAGGSVTATVSIATSGSVTAVATYADVTGAVAESTETNNAATAVIRDAVAYTGTNSTPVAIPDYTTVTSPITVATGPASIQDVTLSVNITHTFDGDLVLTLVSPAGTRVTLSNFRGGGGNNFTDTVFDDFALTAIAGGTAPFAGTYRPEQPLSGLAGQNGNGTWILEVRDAAGADTGTINSWTLNLW